MNLQHNQVQRNSTIDQQPTKLTSISIFTQMISKQISNDTNKTNSVTTEKDPVNRKKKQREKKKETDNVHYQSKNHPT